MSEKPPDPGQQAYEDLLTRWRKARLCFEAADKPQWKRTVEAMLAFKGLKLTPLPPRWRKRVDSAFEQINDILADYPLQTWDDYAKISAADLTRIEKLIIAIL